jgi:hypothetical protein
MRCILRGGNRGLNLVNYYRVSRGCRLELKKEFYMIMYGLGRKTVERERERVVQVPGALIAEARDKFLENSIAGVLNCLGR